MKFLISKSMDETHNFLRRYHSRTFMTFSLSFFLRRRNWRFLLRPFFFFFLITLVDIIALINQVQDYLQTHTQSTHKDKKKKRERSHVDWMIDWCIFNLFIYLSGIYPAPTCMYTSISLETSVVIQREGEEKRDRSKERERRRRRGRPMFLSQIHRERFVHLYLSIYLSIYLNETIGTQRIIPIYL